MDLRKFLTTLPLDKIVHFLIGAVILAMLAPWGVAPALLIVFLLANAKEALDSFVHGTFDFKDMIITFVGGLFMSAWLEFVVPALLEVI